MRRTRLPLLAGLLLTAHTVGHAQIRVGANVQISRAYPQHSHTELLADADPGNANRLVACTHMRNQERNEFASVVYISHDGGATWKPTLEEYPFVDPTCTFGPDGSVYFMAFRYYSDSSDMRLWRSKDGGLTWDQPSKPGVIDREYLTVDRTGGKYHGRVYVNGTGHVSGMENTFGATTITVYHSTDGGGSFRGPALLAAMGTRYVLGMGNGVVLSDGTFAVVFGELKEYGTVGSAGRMKDNTRESSSAVLRFVTSKDGGETLEPAVTIGDFYMHGYPWKPPTTSTIPAVAVDPGSAAFKDRLYVTWVDRRSGHDEIYFAYSADKGKSWSKAVSISDGRSAMDDFHPAIAVNKNGVIGISWYDRRDHADNIGWSVRFRASLDGGETFSPSVPVSEQPFALTAKSAWPLDMIVEGGGTNAPFRRRGGLISAEIRTEYAFTHGGDTRAMPADANGVFRPVWVDNRTGIAQLWTAPVTVTGSAVKHGSPELAALDDVTDRVMLLLTNSNYDRATNRVTMTARLRNTSTDTLRGTLKLRIVGMNSDLGVPVLANGDGGARGAGAVLDFTSLVTAGQLLPGATSNGKSLVFELTDVRPFKQGAEFKFGLVKLDVRVLGRASVH